MSAIHTARAAVPGVLVPRHVRDEVEFERSLRRDLLQRGWKLGDCSYCTDTDTPTVRLPNKMRACYGCYRGSVKVKK